MQGGNIFEYHYILKSIKKDLKVTICQSKRSYFLLANVMNLKIISLNWHTE